jgi:lysozyme
VLVNAAAVETTTAAASPATRRTGRLGVDVSYHSGRVDWETVADAGHEVAFTLSTAGVDFHDPLFSSHWSRMRGVRRGAYHFFVAHDDPRAQARWFIANTPLVAGDLAPVVDIETLGANPPDDLADRLRVFVDTIGQHYGIKPIVYTGPVFWNDNLGPGYGDHPLWIAEYDVPRPTVPRGWSGWALWQQEGDAKVPGVERVADLSRLADDLDLEALVIPRH